MEQRVTELMISFTVCLYVQKSAQNGGIYHEHNLKGLVFFKD